MIGAGVVRRPAAAFLDFGDVCRLGAEIGLGNAQVELGKVELFEFARTALAARYFQVRETQLGVAPQAPASRKLINVDDSKPPRAAVQERSHFTRLSLGLEFLGAHPQNAGGFFQRIKLSHGDVLPAVEIGLSAADSVRFSWKEDRDPSRLRPPVYSG